MKKCFLFLLLLPAITSVNAQGLKPAERKIVQPPADKAKFRLYLLAGQSNMAGRGYPEPTDTTSNLRVLRLNKQGEWEEAKDPLHFDKPVAGVGPGLEFGKTMAGADTSVVIGLIPCAVGGSGIDYWQKGAYYPATKTNPYDDAILRTKKAMKAGTLTGILWHQGESDSKPAECLVYETKLKALIAAFRKDLGMPALPFVAGQLPDFQIYKQDSAGHATVNTSAIKVNEAIADVGKSVPDYGYVTADSTRHRGDVVHFDAASARLMGRRYAREMISLLNKDKRPNIVVILADDMGYSDVSCFGSDIQTPNIDEMAKGGLVMTNFYNASRCCPSRASLLTGLYQHQAGIGDMVNSRPQPAYQGYLNDNCVTIAEALKTGGYNTYMAGKWHVGARPEHWPVKRGFDHYFGLIDGASSYFTPTHPYRPHQHLTIALDDKPFEPGPGWYSTDAYADYAIKYIKDNTSTNKPFFLYMAFTSPHWPLMALPEDIRKYKGRYVAKGWDKMREERLQRMKALGIISKDTRLSPRDTHVPDWSTLTEAQKIDWDDKMAVYAAMVDRMDQNIGRIRAALAETGVADNTLIMFLSDNGASSEYTRGPGFTPEVNAANELPASNPASFTAYGFSGANVSNTPFRLFKHWEYEGGTATPFIAYCPAIIRHHLQSDRPAHLIDLMATCLDAAGVAYPTAYNGHAILPTEGISLLPLMREQPWKGHSALFFEHEGNRAVRQGDWKLVSQYPENKWYLYNIRTDRDEINDLSLKYPQRVEEMAALYEHWAGTHDVMPFEELDKSKKKE
ncbi:MAG TPA: sialate O-acetylesterase [Puia sp.]|nr:sialate O-acetylesterase [Puia sp.]